MPDRWVLPDRSAAFKWCQKRNELGISCILDILGRYNRDEAEAKAARADYISLLNDISRSRLQASISVKPSTLGGTLNRETALRLSQEIAERAAELKIPFELDIEGQRMIDLTLEMAENAARSGLPVTVALQAYLRRTSQDIDTMLDAGATSVSSRAPIRRPLDFDMIQEASGTPRNNRMGRPVLHRDPRSRPIEWACNDLDRDFLEYAFLKGLADETKECMAFEGWNVSEYVPFGKNKEGYETRRRTYLAKLAELGRSPVP